MINYTPPSPSLRRVPMSLPRSSLQLGPSSLIHNLRLTECLLRGQTPSCHLSLATLGLRDSSPLLLLPNLAIISFKDETRSTSSVPGT